MSQEQNSIAMGGGKGMLTRRNGLNSEIAVFFLDFWSVLGLGDYCTSVQLAKSSPCSSGGSLLGDFQDDSRKIRLTSSR